MSTYNWMKNISINIIHYIHPPFLLCWYFINDIYYLLLEVIKLIKYTCKFISCFLLTLLHLSFCLQSHDCFQFYQFWIFAKIYPEGLASLKDWLVVFHSIFKSIQVQSVSLLVENFPPHDVSYLWKNTMQCCNLQKKR